MPVLDRPSLSPYASHAFRHPAWQCGLVLLLLNDHFLKGSGWLPNQVTGKLSDVAGLLVFPAILAWLFRIQTKKPWGCAHLSTALVFGLLQATSVAEFINTQVTLIGLPLRVWADPSDLLALIALPISYRWFQPTSSTRATYRLRWAGVMGLLACCASSQFSPPPRYPYPPRGELMTDVYLRHTEVEARVYHFRAIPNTVEIDCNPEANLDTSLLTEESSWTLEEGDAVPLWNRRGNARDRDCYVVQVHRDGDEQRWIVRWTHGTPRARGVPVRLQNEPAGDEEAIIYANEENQAPRAPTSITILAREP